MTQDDLLDLLEDKDSKTIPKTLFSVKDEKSPKKEVSKKGQQQTLSFMIQRKERKATEKQESKEQKINKYIANQAQL